jgi:hypothetical protein
MRRHAQKSVAAKAHTEYNQQKLAKHKPQQNPASPNQAPPCTHRKPAEAKPHGKADTAEAHAQAVAARARKQPVAAEAPQIRTPKS